MGPKRDGQQAPAVHDSGRSAELSAAGRKIFSGRRLAWLITALCLLFLGLGLYIRLVVLFYDRSLWIDEAYLAGRLFYMNSPFDAFGMNFLSAIGRPMGFYFLSKIFVSLFGYSEVPLRLVASLPSCLVLVFAYWASRKLFKGHPEASLFVVILTSFNFYFIVNSAVYKAYALESLVGASLVLVTANYIIKQTRGSMALAMLAASGSLVFGNNSYFIAPLVFVACFVLALRNRRDLPLFFGLVLVGACVAALVYFNFIYDHIAFNIKRFRRPHLNAFYPGDGGVLGYLGWLLSQLGNLSWTHLLSAKVPKLIWGEHLKAAWYLLSGLALLGAGYLIIRRKVIGLVIVGPMLFMVLANALGKYPLGTARWTSHWGVLLIFSAAYGLMALVRLCSKGKVAYLAVGFALLVSLSILPNPEALTAGFWIPRHITTRSIRPIMKQIKAEVMGPQKGRPVLVHFVPYSSGEFSFYRQSDVYQDKFAFLGKGAVKEWEFDDLGPHPKYEPALRQYRKLLRDPHPRIYFVVTHARADCWHALVEALKLEKVKFTVQMYMGGRLITVPAKTGPAPKINRDGGPAGQDQ